MEWLLAARWHPSNHTPTLAASQAWRWIESLRSIHPALRVWRNTAPSRQEAEVLPPLTQETLSHEVRESFSEEKPRNVITPAFYGHVDTGGKLTLFLGGQHNEPNSLTLQIDDTLGDVLNSSPEVADAIMRSTVETFSADVGTLRRNDHPSTETRPAFRYLPGWKMFFASDSPHYQRATQLATRTSLVGNGSIFTFGTPDTYPTILNQW